MKHISNTLLQSLKLKYIIEQHLLKKHISDEDITYMRKCSYELVRLTNREDAKSYIFLGKINLLDHQHKEAKRNFKKAIGLNPTLASGYHGLFKVELLDENYPSALHNIEKYSYYSGVDTSIYVGLISYLMNGSCSRIPKPDSVLGQRKVYSPLLLNYQLLVQSINENDFDRAFKHVQVCIKLIKDQGYHIDLSYVDLLVTKIKNNVKTAKLKEEITSINHMIETSNNLGQLYLLLTKLYDIDPSNINVLYMLIEVAIAFENQDQLAIYIKQARKLNPTSKRLENYQYIYEEKSDDATDFISIARSKLLIDNLVDKDQYLQAMDLCNKHYEETKNPYYLYKMGVILFIQGFYTEASVWFERYIQSGHHTELKATYYYLFYLSYYIGEEDYTKYASKALELSGFDGMFVNLNCFVLRLLQIEDFSAETIPLIERSLFVGKLRYDTQKLLVNRQEIV